VIEEGKVLWHLIHGDVVGLKQGNSYAQGINSESFRSDSRERTYILKDGEAIERAIASINKRCSDKKNVFDAALPNAGQIDDIREGVPMLVFEGDPGDVKHIEGVVYALRALHIENKFIAADVLIKLHAALSKGQSGLDRDALAAMLDARPADPRAVARYIIFSLPPATDLGDETDRVNRNIRALVIAA